MAHLLSRHRTTPPHAIRAEHRENGCHHCYVKRASPLHRQISHLRYILRMPLPRVQPIIPISRKEPFDDPDWLFEFKYDGFRALLYLEQGSGRFLSRNGNSLTRFDALARAVAAELEAAEAIFDGE